MCLNCVAQQFSTSCQCRHIYLRGRRKILTVLGTTVSIWTGVLMSTPGVVNRKAPEFSLFQKSIHKLPQRLTGLGFQSNRRLRPGDQTPG